MRLGKPLLILIALTISLAQAQTPADLSNEWRKSHLVTIEASSIQHAGS